MWKFHDDAESLTAKSHFLYLVSVGAGACAPRQRKPDAKADNTHDAG